MRDFKPSDNVSPDEPLCIQIPDVGDGLDLNPLYEVDSSDDEPSSIPHYPREWPNYV